MGGYFNLDDILANGNGHFDFSAHPKNIKAGILDLWAVNLIVAAVARSDRNQSQMECILGRWAMKDGYLTPETLVIDTSRMRICENGWVDFKKEWPSGWPPYKKNGLFQPGHPHWNPGGILQITTQKSGLDRDNHCTY